MSNSDNAELTISNNEQIEPIIKSKGGRPSKNIKYVEERKEVLNKLYIILGITDTNKIFYFEDITGDTVKQNQIMNLISDIKKYYNCAQWTYFKNKDLHEPYISIIKAVIKDMNIKTSVVYVKDDKNKNIIKRGLQII